MPDLTPIYAIPKPNDADSMASALYTTPRAMADGIETALQTILGQGTPTAWANVPLGSGWAAGPNGFVYRRHLGVVYLSIHALKGSWVGGEAIGTLPSGFRPSRTLVWAGAVGHTGRILTTGVITVESAASGGGLFATTSYPL
jgi:hypothetical protein